MSAWACRRGQARSPRRAARARKGENSGVGPWEPLHGGPGVGRSKPDRRRRRLRLRILRRRKRVAPGDRPALGPRRARRLATFYSRSRKGRWCKGETSGHFIQVRAPQRRLRSPGSRGVPALPPRPPRPSAVWFPPVPALSPPPPPPAIPASPPPFQLHLSTLLQNTRHGRSCQCMWTVTATRWCTWASRSGPPATPTRRRATSASCKAAQRRTPRCASAATTAAGLRRPCRLCWPSNASSSSVERRRARQVGGRLPGLRGGSAGETPDYGMWGVRTACAPPRPALRLPRRPGAGAKPSWTAKLLDNPALLCGKIREEAGELCQTWEKQEGETLGGQAPQGGRSSPGVAMTRGGAGPGEGAGVMPISHARLSPGSCMSSGRLHAGLASQSPPPTPLLPPPFPNLPAQARRGLCPRRQTCCITRWCSSTRRCAGHVWRADMGWKAAAQGRGTAPLAPRPPTAGRVAGGGGGDAAQAVCRVWPRGKGQPPAKKCVT